MKMILLRTLDIKTYEQNELRKKKGKSQISTGLVSSIVVAGVTAMVAGSDQSVEDNLQGEESGKGSGNMRPQNKKSSRKENDLYTIDEEDDETSTSTIDTSAKSDDDGDNHIKKQVMTPEKNPYLKNQSTLIRDNKSELEHKPDQITRSTAGLKEFRKINSSAYNTLEQVVQRYTATNSQLIPNDEHKATAKYAINSYKKQDPNQHTNDPYRSPLTKKQIDSEYLNENNEQKSTSTKLQKRVENAKKKIKQEHEHKAQQNKDFEERCKKRDKEEEMKKKKKQEEQQSLRDKDRENIAINNIEILTKKELQLQDIKAKKQQKRNQ